MPLPRSLANLKREISEKKWAEARQWAGGWTSKTKYGCRKARGRTVQWLGAPRGLRHGSTKSSRGTALLGSTSTGRRPAATSSRSAPSGSRSRRSCGQRYRRGLGDWEARWRIRDLLADERCSGAVPDFLASTDVGRRAPGAGRAAAVPPHA